MIFVRAPKRQIYFYAVVAVIGFCLAISGCATGKGDSQGAADYVFTGGKVYTVNEDQPWAEAVAVKGNKIVYVGAEAGVAKSVGEGNDLVPFLPRQPVTRAQQAEQHRHILPRHAVAVGQQPDG